jgi:carotenoid cleavage dioxygenase-like enzyme
MTCKLEDAFPIGGDNNWVNGIQVGNEVLMLSDTSLMLRLNLETLEQPGYKSWSNDHKGRPSWMKSGHRAFSSGSAHPVRRPGTNTWVAIASEGTIIPFEKSHVAFYTYEGDVAEEQPRNLIGRSAPLTKSPFMHSFGVTPNYIVMPITLMTGYNPGCTGGGVFCGMSAHWQGIHLIDFHGNVTVFDTTPFAHVHIVNAFENATGVTLDVGAYDVNPFSRTGAMDVSMMRNKTERDANKVKAVIRRVHLHLLGPQTGQVTFMDFGKIHESHSDFYKTNPNYIGVPYCVYYATQWFHNSVSYASMAILKHNLCTDTITYWSRPDVYVGEPFMIPGPSGDEEDGVVVFVTIDGKQNRSSFMTLDAKTMKEVSGTSVDLPRHIPFTGHGDFFAAKGEQAPAMII